MPDGATSPTSLSLAELLNDNGPALRPGERLVAGKVAVFDQDALNAYEADMRLSAMPMDLRGLSWAALGDLHSAWLNVDRRCPGDPLVRALGKRICDERAKRPEYACFRGVA